MARSLHSKRLHRNKKAMRQKYAKKELTKLVKTVSSGDAKPIDVLKKNIEGMIVYDTLTYLTVYKF